MDPQGPVTSPQGQPEPVQEVQTPVQDSGQALEVSPVSDQGQVAQAAPQAEEPTFFDPNALDPSLLPAYKQMQGAFTKKMQALSEEAKTNAQKIQAFDGFMRDPVGEIQRLGQQYGLRITRAEAQAIQDQQNNQDWQPNTWGDVMSRAKAEVLQELSPYLQSLQQETVQMKSQTIERQLDQIDPQWRVYEDAMVANMQAHPTLAKDVKMLYRLSVPEDVFMAKATQEAMRKMQEKGKAAQVSGKSETSKARPAPRQPKTIAEAAEIAKQQLAESQ